MKKTADLGLFGLEPPSVGIDLRGSSRRLERIQAREQRRQDLVGILRDLQRVTDPGTVMPPERRLPLIQRRVQEIEYEPLRRLYQNTIVRGLEDTAHRDAEHSGRTLASAPSPSESVSGRARAVAQSISQRNGEHAYTTNQAIGPPRESVPSINQQGPLMAKQQLPTVSQRKHLESTLSKESKERSAMKKIAGTIADTIEGIGDAARDVRDYVADIPDELGDFAQDRGRDMRGRSVDWARNHASFDPKALDLSPTEISEMARARKAGERPSLDIPSRFLNWRAQLARNILDNEDSRVARSNAEFERQFALGDARYQGREIGRHPDFQAVRVIGDIRRQQASTPVQQASTPAQLIRDTFNVQKSSPKQPQAAPPKETYTSSTFKRASMNTTDYEIYKLLDRIKVAHEVINKLSQEAPTVPKPPVNSGLRFGEIAGQALQGVERERARMRGDTPPPAPAKPAPPRNAITPVD